MAAVVGPQVCLVVMCGLPAVGKSSLARDLREAVTGLGWRFAALCYDELIPEEAFLTSHVPNNMGEMHTEWKTHRRAVLRCIEHFLQNPSSDLSDLPDDCNVISKASWKKCVQDLSKLSLNPVIFILDDNFYYPSMRYEVYQLARKYSLGFCQLFLDCDSETCIRRNQSRVRPVPSEVMEEMERRFEPPNPQKNTWEKSSMKLNTTHSLTANDIQKVVDLILCSLENPLSPVEDNYKQKEADRIICANNVLHQTDQACRKLISETMKTAQENKVHSSTLRTLASELNEQKTIFLQDLKSRLLQDSPFTETENINVEQVVKSAVDDFDQKKRDIWLRTKEKNTASQPS